MSLSEDEELELLELEEAEYQAGKSQSKPEESGWKQLARSTIDTVLPIGGAIGGGAIGGGTTFGAGTVLGGALGYAGGKTAARAANNYLFGDEGNATDVEGILKQNAGDIGEGLTAEMGGKALGSMAAVHGPQIMKGAQSIGSGLKKAGGSLGEFAESAILNATGATGKQAQSFRPGAGRELIDRKLARFGDSPANIANRVGAAKDVAEAEISSALVQLDSQGVTASADNVVAELQKKIASLRKDPSQAGLVKKLGGIIDDIIETGESAVPLSQAEQTKRGFRKAAGNWMDPDAGQAGKQAYLSYMDEVEGAASAADPALAKQFTEAKDTYGLLAPIQEAAERRAMTTSQSPVGGLLDMATTTAAGNPLIGVPAAIARKAISPRITSSVAVTADSASKGINKVAEALMKSPRFSELSQKNPKAFDALVLDFNRRLGGGSEAAVQKVAPNELDRDSSVPANYRETSPPRTSTPTPQEQPRDPKPTIEKSYGKDALLQKTQGTRFQTAMQNAAQRGDKAIATTHFLLQQTNPDYRKAIMEEGDDDEFSGGFGS